jgi:hypothetical protein
MQRVQIAADFNTQVVGSESHADVLSLLQSQADFQKGAQWASLRAILAEGKEAGLNSLGGPVDSVWHFETDENGRVTLWSLRVGTRSPEPTYIGR